MQSVGVLLRLAGKSKWYVDSELVNGIDRTIEGNQIIRDPFILAFRPVYERVMRDPQVYDLDRLSALRILALMPLSEETIQGYFRTCFKDADVNLRVNAALTAGALGYKSLADDIRSLLGSSKDEFEKDGYCDSLAKLGMPCK